MFRVKMHLFLFLTVLAIGVLALTIIKSQRTVMVRAEHKDLVQIPKRYDRVLELRFNELHDVGRFISSKSIIPAYLYTLREYTPQMRETERELWSDAFTAQHEGEDIDAARLEKLKANDGFLQSFSDSLADKISWFSPKYFKDQTPRPELIEQTKQTLVNCMASAVDTCLFKMTYFPLAEEVMPEVQKEFQGRVRVDFAIMLDEHGSGRAHSRNPKWSGKTKFADKYPVIFAARANPDKTFRDIIYFEDTEKHYLVSVSSIQDESRTMGFVVVGSALDSNIWADATLMNAELSYMENDKVLATTFKEERSTEEVRTRATSRTSTITPFETERFMSIAHTLDGNYSNNSLHAVFSRDMTQLTDSVTSGILWMVIGTFVVFLIALILLQIFVRQFMKPLEEIESGIHQIISGNHDYYFPFDYREIMAKSLAEAMNLMVAVLLGKPLPEEEEDSEWIEENIKFAELKAEEHVEENKAELDAAHKALFEVEANAYYKDLFEHFIDAKTTLGHDVAKLTKAKFLHKIAQNETQLRLRMEKSAVRFVVQTKGDDVVLEPVYKD
jgi:hypothetical protein